MSTPARATSRTCKTSRATAQIIPLPTALAAPLPRQEFDRNAWPANVVSYFGYILAHPSVKRGAA